MNTGLSKLGLRGKLLLLMLPAVNVAFIGIWHLATGTAREGLVTLSDANLDTGGRGLADALAHATKDAYADAVTAARLDMTAQAIDSQDPKNLAWYADEIVRSKNRYAAIVVTDSKGEVVAANTVGRDGKKIPKLIGRTVADLPWAKEILAAKGNEAVRVPLHRPKFLDDVLAPGEQVVGFALPVNDVMGDRLGTLSMLVSSAYLGQILGRFSAGKPGALDSLAVVVDSDGRPVILPDGIGESWRARGVTVAGGAHQEWQGPGGARFLVSRAPVAGDAARFGWTVAAMKTLATLEVPVARMSRRLLWAFGAGVLLTSLALVLVATRFVRPIQRLTQAASRTGKASDFTPIKVETTDEIGVLTEAFNRMLGDLKDYQLGLEDKIEARTRDLALAKREVTEILDNMQQAVLTVGPELTVNRQFSAYSRQIFGEVPIAGATVSALLQLEHADQEKRSRMEFWLRNIFGSDELQWMLSESDRIPEIIYRRPAAGGGHDERILRFEYAPMYDKDGALARVMIIAKDVTDVLKLQAEVARKDKENRDNLERASQIASLGPDLFDTFMQEADGLVKESLAGLDAIESGPAPEEAVHLVFRAMHTLKGNARVFKLIAMQNVAHAAEERLEAVRGGKAQLTPESLAQLREQVCQVGDVLDEFGKLGRQVFRREADRHHGGGAMVKVAEPRIAELRQAYTGAVRSLKQANGVVPAGVHQQLEVVGRRIRELTMSSLGEVLIPMRKMALDLAREQNKKVGDLEIVGGDILVDAQLLLKIKDILLHALRNAVDHGLETAEDRLAAQKPDQGRITIACAEENGELLVSVKDDGRGINTDRVKAKAFQLNLLTEDQLDSVPDTSLYEFIFRPGFSTAERVTEVSGRGVGMDVIRSRAEELHGTANIASRRGQGTTLTLRFPVDQYQRL
jgi:signal transduction histidine kinase/HPt (histidine-containing phosphotransfer) domain-containing protein